MFAQELNISIALIVFMGLVSGGMLTLVLMTTRRFQVSFSIILALSALLALLGVFAAAGYVENLSQSLANAMVLLVLSFALGYTLTTFSVLSYSNKTGMPSGRRAVQEGRTAVICLAAGEPPEYGVQSASRRFALTDDPQDSPPVLLRPFYLRDLRNKYARIGRSPYRDYQIELAQKVQSRLDSTHRVYYAFYSDQPTFADTVLDVINEGMRRIVVAHVRVSDPPDQVIGGDLLGGLNPENYSVKMVEVGPLWDSDLLPQIFVRRVLEVVPQVDANPEDIGILLVGRGHVASGGRERSSTGRHNQELNFQMKVRHALTKVGFDDSRVAHGWLRSHRPGVAEALESLARVGCKSVLWMPSTFPADGINTLYDVPVLLEPVAKSLSIRLTPLGAWNADDLAAEDIVERVRTVSGLPTRAQAAQST